MSYFSNSLAGDHVLPHYSIFHTWKIFHFLGPLSVPVYVDIRGHTWVIKGLTVKWSQAFKESGTCA